MKMLRPDSVKRPFLNDPVQSAAGTGGFVGARVGVGVGVRVGVGVAVGEGVGVDADATGPACGGS